ncbi:MAG: SPASM domain-containing protein [Candidatus Zixiibacteriota bacterium]|nr:MAG: SPASM domain-containing protein [candidate division Zixibacteria bacterium]
MPKQSFYNHFQKWTDDYYIAYNACSGAVALMTPEHYATYEALVVKLNAGQKDGFNEKEAELLKQLEYGGFVCPDTHSELQDLQFKHNIARYSCSNLSLVIAPTMACNMACEYCYESNKTGRMSKELIDAMADYVEVRAQGLTSLDITWYGGEPLLAMDMIEELSGRFISLSEKYHYEYGASIVTNGYLLTPEVVDRLCELRVKACQVTLDGPASVHNKKRPLKNGKDSFATIIRNLNYVLGKMAVSVRVNVDQSFSVETIGQLLDELEQAGLREKVSINFGHLEPATQVCSNISESCFETLAFSKVESDFFKLLLEKGFRIDKLPAPSAVCCMSQIVNSFVVDPQGELYRCWNYVGDVSHSMGNIADVHNYQHPNFLKLFSVDPFEYETCRECNLLPICMGGCPDRRVSRGLSSEQVCETWKYNLEPMLEIIAASRQQEARRRAKEQS